MKMNRVALLIPHFNDSCGLYASLASIQEDEEVDVFVVDDGSLRDRFDQAICDASFHAKGVVHYLYLPENKGIEHALNAGLREIIKAPYDYMARLDCNNRNVGSRLRRQCDYLDANPDVYLLGGAAVYFRGEQECFTVRHPLDHQVIQRHMQVDSAFVHSTVMLRLSVVAEIGFYPSDYPAAEDFSYFWRLMRLHKVANLPDVLIRNEYNDAGISLSRRRRQQFSRFRVLLANYDGSLHATAGLIKPLVSLLLPLSWARFYKRRLGIRAWS